MKGNSKQRTYKKAKHEQKGGSKQEQETEGRSRRGKEPRETAREAAREVAPQAFRWGVLVQLGCSGAGPGDQSPALPPGRPPGPQGGRKGGSTVSFSPFQGGPASQLSRRVRPPRFAAAGRGSPELGG